MVSPLNNQATNIPPNNHHLLLLPAIKLLLNFLDLLDPLFSEFLLQALESAHSMPTFSSKLPAAHRHDLNFIRLRISAYSTILKTKTPTICREKRSNLGEVSIN